MIEGSQLSSVGSSSDEHRRINCLFIVPSLKRAGAESQLVDLVNRLDSERFSKTIVVLEDNLDQIDKVEKDSVEVVCIPKRSRIDFGQVRKIAKLIDNLAIDIIHATIQYSVLIAWLAMLRVRRRPKLVSAIHTTQNVGIKEEFFDRYVYRPLLRRCDHIIFVCTHQRAYWISRYPELSDSSSVIYNGIDPQLYRKEDFRQQGDKLLKSLNMPAERFVIASIAGFRREKGHAILFKAFSGLPVQAHLLLAGDGVMRREMEELALELGIGDRVHFLGNVSDVRPILSVSDVMVLASTAVETFSMAMLEAMSMKVPVIASDIGGLCEAIEEGVTGHLVPPGNSRILLDAIRTCMGTSDLSVIQNRCREVVLERFTSDDMVSATEVCLLSMVGRK